MKTFRVRFLAQCYVDLQANHPGEAIIELMKGRAYSGRDMKIEIPQLLVGDGAADTHNHKVELMVFELPEKEES